MHAALRLLKAVHTARRDLLLLFLFLLLLQVISPDIMDATERRTAEIRAKFSLDVPNGPVTEEVLHEWLTGVSEVSFLSTVAENGNAKTICDAGFASVHSIAGITRDELTSLGFQLGIAKCIAQYLGSPIRAPSPARPLPAGNYSALASAQHSAQIGAAVAMAVTTSQTKIKLFDGSSSRPSMNACIKWTKKHVEKANISGFPTVSMICNKLTQDINMELAPELLAEPARSDDAAYAREVLSSLTPDQFEKYGDTERLSGCLLLQNVLKSVADSKTPIYVHHITAFAALQVTPDSHAMKGRFSDAEAKPLSLLRLDGTRCLTSLMVLRR